MLSYSICKLTGHTEPPLHVMFEARKRVFVDLLKWDVPVLDEKYEVDQFDTPDAHYLVLTDMDGSHRSSARLLPTEGPHILAGLFPSLCDGPLPSGPAMREITRFCIEPSLRREERLLARNQLVTSLVQYALQQGITDYVAVASAAWFRQIMSFGWQCAPLGGFQKSEGTTLVALRIGIDETTSASLEAKGIFCASSFDAAGARVLQ